MIQLVFSAGQLLPPQFVDHLAHVLLARVAPVRQVVLEVGLVILADAELRAER